MKCVRCSSNKAKSKGGRCPKCLALLKKRKQDPNRHEHYDAIASDSMRRQKGTGKSSKKSKGLGTTQDVVKKLKAGYAKYGKSTKLSPDRVHLNEGYSPNNVRVAPRELNRGRHHLDTKKLAAWKKRVQKSNIDLDDLQKSCIQKAYDLGQSEVAIAFEIRSDFIKKLFKN